MNYALRRKTLTCSHTERISESQLNLLVKATVNYIKDGPPEDELADASRLIDAINAILSEGPLTN